MSKKVDNIWKLKSGLFPIIFHYFEEKPVLIVIFILIFSLNYRIHLPKTFIHTVFSSEICRIIPREKDTLHLIQLILVTFSSLHWYFSHFHPIYCP